MGAFVRLLLIVGLMPWHAPVCPAASPSPQRTTPATKCSCCHHRNQPVPRDRTPDCDARRDQAPTKQPVTPCCPQGCPLCSAGPVLVLDAAVEPRIEAISTDRVSVADLPITTVGYYRLLDRPPRA